MDKYTVYVHVNKENGRRYVGLTKNKPYKRWKRGEGYKLVRGDFYSDIQKYGWNSFEHLIIAEDLEYDDAIKLERELVRNWKTNDPEFGYNVSQGGRSGVRGSRNGVSRPVVMVKDGRDLRTFDSAAEAADFVNGFRSNIINACKGRIKSAYGCQWKYADNKSVDSSLQSVV